MIALQFKHHLSTLSSRLQRKKKYIKNWSSRYPRFNHQRFLCKRLNQSWIDDCDIHDERKQILRNLKSGNRIALSKMITLVESTRNDDRIESSKIIESIIQARSSQEKINSIPSFRIGLSGPPGVGKSTFIEAFGLMLLEKGYKIAVLAVDPSSARTGGSILGDKTRMIELSRRDEAYVRPSPSRGSLGGVTSKTNEIILLLEEAGYDIILVETVGVGQSEIAVEDMVDMFVLLSNPTAGDELQGIKKGIVEISDLILINKADGDLIPKARIAQYEYMTALKFIRHKSEKWTPKVLSCSAITRDGLDKVWSTIHYFWHSMEQNGEIAKKRANQRESWMWKLIHDELNRRLETNKHIKENLPNLQVKVRKGEISPPSASHLLFQYLFMQDN